MKKTPQSLPDAIKIIVDKYGKNVVSDVRLVNIINDVAELENSVVLKNVLRDILYHGYGKKLLEMNSQKEDCKLKVKTYSKEISDNYGYKDIIVQYILYSIAYGLGMSLKPHLKSLESPIVKENIPHNTNPGLQEERKISIPAIILAAFFLLSVGGYGMMYMLSGSDREKFDSRISSGHSFMMRGDYVNAVESYKEAYMGYDAFNSKSYKQDAVMHMQSLNKKLLNEGHSDNKTLLQAYQAINAELQLDLNSSDREILQKDYDDVKQLIQEKTDNGLHSLIANISANKGKIDKSGKTLLKELLALSPDDYWLNFINKKSYE